MKDAPLPLSMPPIQPKPRVTDVALRTAKPADKPYKISIGGSLYLEVTPSGSKLWRWKYRMDGRENRFALGSYPDVSMKDAVAAAEAARKQVKAGVHPSHEKKLERIKAQLERADTFEALALEWVQKKEWEPKTKDRRRRDFENHVFPKIGKLPVRSITPAHILSLLQTVEKTAPTVAAQLRRSMSGVFELAVATLRADNDPVYPVRKALVKRKTLHKTPVRATEIAQLLQAMDQHGGSFMTKAAFKLMWLTLLRPNEAVQAEWSEIDLEAGLWRVQAHRMKRRQEHHTPLPRQAIELLRTMKGISGSQKHVFPHRDVPGQPMKLETLRQAIYKTPWKGKYSPHATRATGSTWLNEKGFDSDWVEKQLAHGDTDPVRATYNFAAYMKGRRKMMQQWADWLDGLTKKFE